MNDPFAPTGGAQVSFIAPTESQYTREANRLVSLLISELDRQMAWVDVIAIERAIRNVRRMQDDHEREERHLAGDPNAFANSPSRPASESST